VGGVEKGEVSHKLSRADSTTKVIDVFWFHFCWAFLDENDSLGPWGFFFGQSSVMERLLATVPHGTKSEEFKLRFGVTPFPGYQVELVWARKAAEDDNCGKEGNWYIDDQQKEIVFPSSFFHYFKEVPEKLYFKGEWFQ